MHLANDDTRYVLRSFTISSVDEGFVHLARVHLPASLGTLADARLGRCGVFRPAVARLAMARIRPQPFALASSV